MKKKKITPWNKLIAIIKLTRFQLSSFLRIKKTKHKTYFLKQIQGQKKKRKTQLNIEQKLPAFETNTVRFKKQKSFFPRFS